MKTTFFFRAMLLFLFCFCLNKQGSGHTSNPDTTSINPKVKAVFVNGDSIHYIDIGKGVPVIFIHGALGDYRGFKGQRDVFSKNHRVIVYSRRYAFPDHQPIADSLNYTITPHVNDLVGLIKALNLGTVHLIGHSFGAVVALQVTMDHPELVRSVTLGEPPYRSLMADSIWNNFVTDFVNPSADAFKKGDNKKAVEIFVHGVMGDSLLFSMIPAEDVRSMMENIPETRAIAFTKDPFPAVTCQDLQKVKVPVLLVEGDKSPALFTAATDELERCLSNNELLILHNATHALQNQNPSEFNEIVLQFIDRH